MAEVFVATHEGAAGFQRAVCIKRILPHLSADPEFRELFVREARVAGRLSHAGIVQVFDCVEEGDALAIVMELVPGMDLRRLQRELRSRGEHVPTGIVAHIAGGLLAALRFAHDQGVIHRDVSPHNVLVSREGEVKLADFGVAKALHSHATKTGEVKGKLAYMSPEQARGDAVDERTDLYATGLVVYELLTGTRFFPKVGQAELVAAVIRAEKPRLDGVVPEMVSLVERLLAPRREDRFASALDAIEALPSWELSGPLGALELARLVRRLEDEPEAAATEECAGYPSALLRGGDPEETDLLRGGTAVAPRSERRVADRPVVVQPPDAPTVTRAGVEDHALALAATEELGSEPGGAGVVLAASTEVDLNPIVEPVVRADGGRSAMRAALLAGGVLAALLAAALGGYHLFAPSATEGLDGRTSVPADSVPRPDDTEGRESRPEPPAVEPASVLPGSVGPPVGPPPGPGPLSSSARGADAGEVDGGVAEEARATRPPAPDAGPVPAVRVRREAPADSGRRGAFDLDPFGAGGP